ncbi:MAG: glycosyltransferase family 4 protein [Acidimicrobiales bacterium]
MRVAVTLEQCWHRVPGGIARSAIDQAAAVAARGDVELVGVAARHDTVPADPWTPPVEVRHLPLPRLALYESWHHLGRPGVERATGSVDVIHATGVAVPPRTAPLVVTVHDLAVLHDTTRHTRRGVSFARTAWRRTLERADLVTCPSQATLDDCVEHGVDPGRLRLVPWGVDPVVAGPDDVARVRVLHGLPERFVVFVGTHEPRKNLARLVEAFARLGPDHDDVELVLVGPQGWGDDIAPHLASLGDRVRQPGFVPSGDLAAFYAAATVSCYPSLLEGFGLPVLEAMAQGTPVVTSSGTSTEELVAGGGGVAVDPRDTDAIAEALALVLSDGEAAERMGRAALATAAAYSWDRTAESTVAVYRELVS